MSILPSGFATHASNAPTYLSEISKGAAAANADAVANADAQHALIAQQKMVRAAERVLEPIQKHPAGVVNLKDAVIDTPRETNNAMFGNLFGGALVGTQIGKPIGNSDRSDCNVFMQKTVEASFEYVIGTTGAISRQDVRSDLKRLKDVLQELTASKTAPASDVDAVAEGGNVDVQRLQVMMDRLSKYQSMLGILIQKTGAVFGELTKHLK